MGNLFNENNPVIRGLAKIIDCIIVNACWLICNFPVLFIVYLCVAAQNYILMPAVLIFMVLSGPSTSALYYVIIKNIKRSRGYAWSEFWNGFKNSFGPAFISGIVVSAFLMLMAFDAYAVYGYMYHEKIGPFCWVFAVMACICTMWAIYLSAYIARFNDRVSVAMKNSFIIMIVNFPRSFCLLVLLVGFLLFFYWFWPLSFMAMLFLPAVYMLVKSAFIEKIFRKYMSEEDLAAEEEIDNEGR